MQITEIKNGVRYAKGSEVYKLKLDIDVIKDIDFLFKNIMVESGFENSHRDRVWNHPKDKNLSVQFVPETNKLWVEYKYNSDCLVIKNVSQIEFINESLSFIRDFYKLQTSSK
jgi:hypothetical protein